MKTRTGYVYKDKQTGNWYARIGYTKNNGKRSSIKRKVTSKAHGKQVLRELVATFQSGGRKALDAEKLTFIDLCVYYSEHYLVEAQYANGRKVGGLRSLSTVKGYVKVFREHFGNQGLKSITYDDLRTFRTNRLKTDTHQSKHRSLTTVNREMAYLRRMLNIGERNGWIVRNPFKLGDTLIHAVDEQRRARVLTPSECQKLVDACKDERAHLRPIIIAGLDTGCRMRELLKLRWRDVDIEDGVITIQAFNTKTMRERKVAITARLALELERLLKGSPKENDLYVFGGVMNVRQSFRHACKDAGLDEVGKERVTFHHLRHTHAVRLDDLGFSLTKIGAQLGHVVWQTTLRYASHRDREAVRAVGEALDAHHAQARGFGPSTESELVN